MPPVGSGHIDIDPASLRGLLATLNGHLPAVQARHVNWVRTQNPDGAYGYAAHDVSPDGVASPKLLSSQDLHNIYGSDMPIVNSGDVPHGSNWAELTGNKGAVTIIHEKNSLNRDWKEVSEATALGGRPLPPNRTIVYNALPQETEIRASAHERARMNITGSKEAWKAVNDQIHDASAGIQSHVATKQALLDEFARGDSDVIVVYAHFDGLRLHLPGGSAANHANLADYTIGIDELAKIDRTSNPPKNRVIVLAGCSTASHPVNADSLVQVLLNRGMARTVLATDKPYDARDIPALMQRLKAQQPLRQAGGQLRQYVELQRNGLPAFQPYQLSSKESEVHSGE